MIFAREINAPLTSLVKKLDEAAAGQKGKMGSFVVFCNDADGLDKKLKDLAENEAIKNVALTIFPSANGPDGYDISKDADVTVVFYVNKTVKVNYAFKKGQLKDSDIESILGDLPKILK